MKTWKVGLASMAFAMMLVPMAGAGETAGGYTALEGVAVMPMTAHEMALVQGQSGQPQFINVPLAAANGAAHANANPNGIFINSRFRGQCPGPKCGANPRH